MTTASELMKEFKELYPKYKEIIEKLAHYLGTGCEILAMTVGEFFPILKIFLVCAAKLLKYPISEEMKEFMKQCEIIKQKLEMIEHQFKAKERAQQRSSLNIQNFESMAHINSQFTAYMKIFTAEPGAREMMKNEFFKQFENTKKDTNLDHLYMSLIGEKREPMLDTIMASDKWSKKAVEEFCAGLKKLFVMGILALMGYTELKNGTVDEGLFEKWHNHMGEVDKRMNMAVEECVERFPEQAKDDLNEILSNTRMDRVFAQFLLKFFVDKYYFVSVSVRVLKHKSGQNVCGEKSSYFEREMDGKKIVVSFTKDPKPLEQSKIEDLIKKRKGNVTSVATELPNCVVHVVKSCDLMAEESNFASGQFYSRSYNEKHFFIHSK